MKVKSKLVLLGILTLIFMTLVCITPTEVKAARSSEWIFFWSGFMDGGMLGGSYICYCPNTAGSCACMFTGPATEN